MKRQPVTARVYRSLTDYFRATGDTRQHLADVLGVHRSYLGKIESGQRTPSLRLALKLAEATHVPMETLLGYTPKRDKGATRAKLRARVNEELGVV